MVAVLSKPPRRRMPAQVRIREDVARTVGPLTVDREKKIIYRVKVCGLESKNGRRYPTETLRAALGLYENASVYLNHPGSEGGRDADNLLGKIVAPKLEADGIYGDFHYLAADKRMDKFCEVAERMSEQLGFSHNIEADGEYQGDVLVVTKILEVQSVDLVADPATTRGLFEGRTVAKTFREWLQARPANKLAEKWITEDDAAPVMDMPADAPVETGDHKDDLLAAIRKLLDSSDPADQALASKIMNLLKSSSAPEVAEEDDTPEKKDDADGEKKEAEGDDEKKDDEKKKEESVQVQLSRLKLELASRKLCESLGYFPTDVQVKALASLGDEERKELAESFKPQTYGRRAQSAAPIGLHESNGVTLTPEVAGNRWRE